MRRRPPPLAPGSACAVVLVSGDAQLGAIGTTSLVDGDRVVLMGHPFLQVGPVDLPLATAEVVTMFPSRVMSFKMASAGQVVGRVTHDQRAGLAGRLGEFATTVPVKVRVEDGAVVQQYAYEVALEPQLTPALAFWCVYNSLLASGDDGSLQTVSYDLTTRWRTAAGEELPPVRLSGVTAGPGSVAAIGGEWVPLLRLLMNSRHASLVPTAVEAVLRAQRPLDAAFIVGVQAPARVAPGESFAVGVDLEAWRGAPRRETITLTVPAELPPGRYKVGVASATDFFALDAQRAPGLFRDDNLDATLALLAVRSFAVHAGRRPRLAGRRLRGRRARTRAPAGERAARAPGWSRAGRHADPGDLRGARRARTRRPAAGQRRHRSGDPVAAASGGRGEAPMRCWPIGMVVLAVGLIAGEVDAAGPSFWDTLDFAEVELDGAGLDPLGRLVPGMKVRTVLQDSSLVFWRAVPGEDGEIYLGSGHGGQIWRLSPQGEAELLAATDGTEIFSLLRAGRPAAGGLRARRPDPVGHPERTGHAARGRARRLRVGPRTGSGRHGVRRHRVAGGGVPPRHGPRGGRHVAREQRARPRLR